MGDQIFAFQTEGEDLGALDLGDLRFLFGLQSNSNVFQGSGDGMSGDPSDANQSGVPEGLIEGMTALARGFGPGDEDFNANIVYTGPTTGTRAALQAAIADPSNWSGSATALTQATLAFTVTDAAANSVPVLTVPMGSLVTAEDTALDITAISVADADGDALTITLTASSTVTVVATGSAVITDNGTDTVTISGSVAEVNAALATVTYLPTQDFNGTGTLRIAAADGSGAFDAFILDIVVTSVNDAPLLANIDANVGFTGAQMMAGPQFLFTAPNVTDVDSANLDTGALTVSYSGGPSMDDQLSIFSSALPDEIEIDGVNVNFLADGGFGNPPIPMLIGTITSDGRNGSDLVIIFNSAATPDRVNLVVNALQYQNTNGAPSGARDITMSLSDGDGATSLVSSTTVTITNPNAGPTLSDLESTLLLDPADVLLGPQDVDTDVTLVDADSADFDGGNLTITYTAGLPALADDQLTLQDSGTPGVGIEIAGAVVSFDGNVIGAITSGGTNGADLVVDFAGAFATPAAVEALIEALQFQNTDAAPSGQRELSITVNDGDGGTSAAQTIAINIAGTPPPPSTDLIYTEGDGIVAIDADDAIIVGDPAPNDFSTGSLTVSIAMGVVGAEDELSLTIANGVGFFTFGADVVVSVDGVFVGTVTGGGAGGGDLVISFPAPGALGSTFPTLEQVQRIISAIAYSNTGGDVPTDGDRDITFTLVDSSGGMGTDLGTITVDVEPVEDVPMLTDLVALVSFDSTVATAAPQDIDTDVTVTDVDTVDFDGGSVSIGNTGAGLAGDQLSIMDSGTPEVGIEVSGATVSFNGLVIGTISSDGSNGSDLVIDLTTTNATAAAVEALIEALQYQNTDPTPDNSRTFRIDITDGEGGVSSGNPFTVELTGIGVNLDPTISDAAANVVFIEDTLQAAPQLIDIDVNVADPDSTDFDGGTLTLAYSAAPVPAVNHLSIMDSGMPGVGIEVLGTAVSFNGVQIGTITDDGVAGNDLIIALSGVGATAAAVEALIEALQYQNTSDNPDPQTDVTLQLTDGDGGTSALIPIALQITASDDAAVAQDDAFAPFDENTASVALNLFTDNGAGLDFDPDSGFSLTDVDGGGLMVINLASGAIVTVIDAANGDIVYDLNGAFASLPALGSGASNTTATETFTYTISGGDTATVTLTINGVDSDDIALGTTGDDVINSGIGNDTVTAGLGADTVDAGDGDDIIIDEDNLDPANNDSYDGGAGNDTLVSTAIQWGPDVIFDLLAGNQRSGAGFATINDTLTNIENVTVNGRAQIRGDDGDNILTAINGGGAGGPGSFANIIDGEGGNDIIDAGEDDDVLSGGAGNDIFIGDHGNDSHDGGTGRDTIDYSGSSSAVEFSALAAGTAGDATGDTFTAVEIFIGTDFDDIMGGDNASNLLFGGDGMDMLTGEGGNDRLFGEAGDDTLEGGAGNDVHSGGTGNDTFIGGAGNDILLGGAGVDTVDYSGALAAVELDIGTGGTVGDAAGDTYFGIERFIGSAFDDIIVGNGSNNQIFGNDGADTLNGNGGNDRLFGEAGDDTLNGGDGNDIHSGGFGDDRFIGGQGNDILLGGAGFDTADYINSASAVTVNLATGGTAGDAAGDTYFGIESVFGSQFGDSITGSAGNDTLIGYIGNDMLTGSGGVDAFVYFQAFDGADTITDFDVMSEVIVMQDALAAFDTFAEVIAAATDDGTDTTIDFGGGNILTLLGVLVGDLSAGNFTFPMSPPPGNTDGGAEIDDFIANIQSVELMAFLAQPMPEPVMKIGFAEDMFEVGFDGDFDVFLL